MEVGNRSDGSIPSRHRFVSRRLQAAVHLSGSRLKVDQSQQSASFPSQWKRPVRLPHPQPCRLNRSQLLTSSYLSKLCPSGVECSCCPTSEQKSCHSWPCYYGNLGCSWTATWSSYTIPRVCDVPTAGVLAYLSVVGMNINPCQQNLGRKVAGPIFPATTGRHLLLGSIRSGKALFCPCSCSALLLVFHV